VAPPSVLIVTNSHDRRDSTEALRRIADTLEQQHGAKVSVFLLRPFWGNPAHWPGARTVDDLRTWIPAALLERLVSPTLAGRLRGLRLRWWLRQAEPDVVILDDALGWRVVENLRPRPVVINRLNRERPRDADYEPGTFERPDLVVAAVDLEIDLPDTTPIVREHPFRDLAAAARYTEPDARAEIRRRLGVPDDAVLVCGWGSDGWLDGPDLFVRVLWALEDRHGVRAHGVWFGTEQADEVRRLEEEADRCGIADRYQLLPYHGQGEVPTDALCADVLCLPTREPLLRDHLMVAIASGLVLVTFAAADLEDPSVRMVDDLDVDAAAEEIIGALALDRSELAARVLAQLDPVHWTRRLLDDVSRMRG
jgi:hypothetical protein